MAIFLMSGSALAEIFPYDINITHTKNPMDLSEEVLILYQKDKEVFRLDDYLIYTIHRGDLDADGYDEIVIKSYSGGAHCCFAYCIVSLRPKISKPYCIDTVNYEKMEIRDIDGDHKAELIFGDDRYSWFGDLSFAHSPGVQVVAQYKDNRLKLNAELTKLIHKNMEVNLTRTSVLENAREGVSINENGSDVISYVLYLFYVGEQEAAIKILHKYFYFQDSAIVTIFLDSLIGKMKTSPFWDDIRVINHWYQNVPYSPRTLCKQSKALWRDINVQLELYRKLESLRTKF